MSQVHAVSQADEPSRLRGSRRARTRPAQRRGRWGRSFTDWSMAMDDEVFNHRWTTCRHSFFCAAARERHRRACWHRHQARLR